MVDLANYGEEMNVRYGRHDSENDNDTESENDQGGSDGCHHSG
jgi:hypothetical protein